MIAVPHQDAPCSQLCPTKFPHQSTNTGVGSGLRAGRETGGHQTSTSILREPSIPRQPRIDHVMYLCLLQHGCVVHVEFSWH